MPNPDYNSQVGNGYSKKGGAQGAPVRKGGGKTEGMKKDTLTKWPNPQPEWKSSFNKAAKFPVVKTRVVSHGID